MFSLERKSKNGARTIKVIRAPEKREARSTLKTDENGTRTVEMTAEERERRQKRSRARETENKVAPEFILDLEPEDFEDSPPKERCSSFAARRDPRDRSRRDLRVHISEVRDEREQITSFDPFPASSSSEDAQFEPDWESSDSSPDRGCGPPPDINITMSIGRVQLGSARPERERHVLDSRPPVTTRGRDRTANYQQSEAARRDPSDILGDIGLSLGRARPERERHVLDSRPPVTTRGRNRIFEQEDRPTAPRRSSMSVRQSGMPSRPQDNSRDRQRSQDRVSGRYEVVQVKREEPLFLIPNSGGRMGTMDELCNHSPQDSKIRRSMREKRQSSRPASQTRQRDSSYRSARDESPDSLHVRFSGSTRSAQHQDRDSSEERFNTFLSILKRLGRSPAPPRSRSAPRNAPQYSSSSSSDSTTASDKERVTRMKKESHAAQKKYAEDMKDRIAARKTAEAIQKQKDEENRASYRKRMEDRKEEVKAEKREKEDALRRKEQERKDHIAAFKIAEAIRKQEAEDAAAETRARVQEYRNRMQKELEERRAESRKKEEESQRRKDEVKRWLEERKAEIKAKVEERKWREGGWRKDGEGRSECGFGRY